MFGYVVINEPELRIREFDLYRSYYCGLCEDLHHEYGRFGQLTLNYDTTFLGFLLTCLYEPEDETFVKTSCIVHPLSKRPKRRNKYTQYAADVTILLSWYSMRDNWEDEQQIRGLAMSGILHGAFKKAKERYPEKAQVIADCLDRLHALENQEKQGSCSDHSDCNGPSDRSDCSGPSDSIKRNGPSDRNGPDAVSKASGEGQNSLPEEQPSRPRESSPREVSPDEAGACFGDLMAELFAFQHDEWEQPLRRMGFYLGKFIYLLDAYDDLEDDAESGSFNPLLPVRARMQENGSDFDGYVRALLTMLMASCTRAFEILPIVENIDILRNILYAGVWTKFEEIYAKRTGACSDCENCKNKEQDENKQQDENTDTQTQN